MGNVGWVSIAVRQVRFTLRVHVLGILFLEVSRARGAAIHLGQILFNMSRREAVSPYKLARILFGFLLLLTRKQRANIGLVGV